MCGSLQRLRESRHRRCNLHSERSRVAAGYRSGDGATRRIPAFPAVVAMVDRAVRVDWVLLAAGGVAAGPDAESSGACDAGRNGVARRILPILSLVVLSRLACVHRRASRFLSDGGETRDMIGKNLPSSTAHYRYRARHCDSIADGIVITASLKCFVRQEVATPGDY
jgi:hypothetical protein